MVKPFGNGKDTLNVQLVLTGIRGVFSMEAEDQSIDAPSGESKARATESSSRDPGKTKRFRFKASPGRSSGASVVNAEEGPTRRKRHRYHHSYDGHRKRRKATEHAGGGDDPSVYDDSASRLPPDTAFRESLFDALGDDEGAAFWEGLYGQPIHTYSNTYQDPETGELEQMNEDEYTQFVRRKMWEKSWEGIEAAKEEKRKEKGREKKKIRHEENQEAPADKTAPFGYVFDMEVENSLKRGEQRKEKRRWKGLWEDYLHRCEELQQLAKDRTTLSADSEQLFLRNKIAWPVETSKRKEVKPENIERFIIKGTQSSASADEAKFALMNALKAERVRWHPDKMQQRYGFMEIDEGTMAGVTATFQVFDRMWNDRRTKQ